VPARRGLGCESWSSRGQLAPSDAGGPEGAAPMLVRRSVTHRLGEALQEAVVAEAGRGRVGRHGPRRQELQGVERGV
jgi:hypothetical protein